MAGIKVKNLSKTFKNFKAVDGISFEVAENRVMGFLGPNGAGKTTTLRMLVGLSRPDSGEIEIAGERVVFGSSEAHRYLGYLPEQPAFYGWMTGEEYLKFIADSFKLDKPSKKIEEVLMIVNLLEARKKRIAAYSNGMKQRLGIAQALINDPKVLIMDEPVSALDPIGRREVMQVISRLKEDKTILLSTHILSDVDRICDDVIIINRGKIVTESPLSKLKEKYAQPILEVEFEQDVENILDDLKKEPWVKSFDGGGNHLKIHLQSPGALDGNKPLKYLVKQDHKILKYGLIMPEVEDLFVDLIKEAK